MGWGLVGGYLFWREYGWLWVVFCAAAGAGFGKGGLWEVNCGRSNAVGRGLLVIVRGYLELDLVGVVGWGWVGLFECLFELGLVGVGGNEATVYWRQWDDVFWVWVVWVNGLLGDGGIAWFDATKNNYMSLMIS